MMTHMQTTFHTDPNGDAWISKSFCPVFPPNTTKLECENGDKYFQLRDRVIRLGAQGVISTWYNKPSMMSAIKAKPSGAYYQYFADGQVYQSNNQQLQITWSRPTTPTKILDGTPLYGYFDPVHHTYADPIPCRMCGDNCEGGDYEDWRFCSRSCMVECSRED